MADFDPYYVWLGIPPRHSKGRPPLDFVHLFVKSQAELDAKFPLWAAKLAPAGMLWISWPKKSSGVESDLDENIVRSTGLATDPICGMQVQTTNAPAQRTRNGTRYWFCSDRCANAFDNEPSRYAK